MKLILKNSSIEMMFHSFTWSELSFSVNNRLHTYINSGSNAWSEENGYCYIISKGTSSKIRVLANNSKRSGIAFLTDNSHVNLTRPNYCEGTGNIIINEGEEMEFKIPNDCNYIYIMSGVSSTPASHLPSRVEVGELA